MLVLTRKLQESIRLTLSDGRVVLLKVVKIDGKQIRLGIEAPRDVKIVREELTGSDHRG